MDIKLVEIPVEVIAHILEVKKLSFTDVCNFGSTCSRFWNLINKHGNNVWKSKFNQMWPQLADKEFYKCLVSVDWLNECRHRCLIKYETLKLIRGLAALHFNHAELCSTDFAQFEQLMDSRHQLALDFMIDELMLCFHQPDKYSNLTMKYYCEKTLRYLRQIDITKKWLEFRNMLPEKQILERGAVLIAQWSQPTEEITDVSIGAEFDRIAHEVTIKLAQEYGESHAALQVPSELRSHWRTHNIPDNYFSERVCQQIIAAIACVLFKDMGFCGYSDLYHCYEHSYINRVLSNRCGIPITLAIVYESVARRLGIKCEPVSFPGNFLLRWRDSYKENVEAQSFYIDVFNGGVFLGKNSCPQTVNSSPIGRCSMSNMLRFGAATATEVMERMANNLEMAERQRTVMNGRTARLRSALELGYLINPNNTHCMLQLARFYMQHNMSVRTLRRDIEQDIQIRFNTRDLGQADNVLRSIMDYNENYSEQLRKTSQQELKVKRRTDVNVQYSVGLVMHHRNYHYTCVIVDWDPTCTASEEWILQMHKRGLSRQDNQPFYHVLAEDGTNRYAAEEKLELVRGEEDSWVTHSEVGRYFHKFCGNHFLLNAEMLRAYPDDPPVTAKLLGLK